MFLHKTAGTIASYAGFLRKVERSLHMQCMRMMVYSNYMEWMGVAACMYNHVTLVHRQ